MNLKKMTVKDLRKLAAKHGVAGRSKMRKPELIKALQPLLSPRQAVKAVKAAKPAKKAEKPPETTRKIIPASPRLTLEETYLKEEDLASLPFSYNEDLLTLLPKNPEQLYAYWDLSTQTWERIADKGPLVLRLELAGDGPVSETLVPNNTREYFFRIPDSRGPYRVVLGQQDHGKIKILMVSEPVKAPPNHPGQGEVRFAKVPFGTPLPELLLEGGLMEPARSEMPKGGFFTPDTDDTPYTRRFQ